MGFARLDGDGQRWLLLGNGQAKVGLFQKMFEENILTFDPPDARALEAALRAKGYTPERATEGEEGPTSAVFRDPDGNVVLIDQHDPGPQAPPPDVGEVGWVDLTVDDAASLSRFYADVLGMAAEGSDMGGYEDFCLRDPARSAPSAGVCHARGPNAGLPPAWLVYFVVEDIEASVARCEAGGGAVIRAPSSDASEDRVAVIRDPAGAVCALYQAAG